MQKACMPVILKCFALENSRLQAGPLFFIAQSRSAYQYLAEATLDLNTINTSCLIKDLIIG
jgi:hypothetical protein